MLFILDANCCVRMHFPTEMYPLSCATKKLAYATMQPSSSPQTHPSTKPMLINHFIIAFTVRREASASIDVFVLVDVERRPTRIIMWCVFSQARWRIQLHRFRDRCSIKQARIQAESLQWIAVWRPIGRGADMPKIYCAQGMLRIIHTKLAANVAIATSKTESAEKKESVDACWSSLEQLYPAVSAAAVADGMVGLSGDGFLAWSGGSWIFNYTRLLNCKWLMWRIGHGTRIIPTFSYFAFVTFRGPVLSPIVTLFCGNDTKTLPW